MQFQTFDDRPPLAQQRRVDLWRLADRFQVDYPAGATKDQMLEILKDVDFSKPPQPKAAEKPLDEMSVFELRKVCKVREIPFQRTDTKVALLEKLSGLHTPQ